MALTLVVLVAALLLLELTVSAFVQQRRQRGLVAEFAKPSPTIADGDALAILQIEKIKLNEVVVNGDGPDLLRGGPGLKPGTPAPGGPGNSVIVGRRLRYGGPMARLGELAPGDQIVVWVRNTPHPVAFRVTRKRRVEASARPPAAGATTRLTLVTAASGLVTTDLLLVEGELVGVAPKTTPGTTRAGRDGRPTTWVSPASGPVHVVGTAAWIASLLGLGVGLRWLRRRLPAGASLLPIAAVAAVAVGGLALTFEGITPRLL
jgi:sortase A